MHTRSRFPVALLTAIALLAIAAAGVVLRHRLHHNIVSAKTVTNSQTIRLPFALPCSSNSGDAGLFYAALRRGDRKAVTGMFAAKKVYLIQKGTPLSILPEQPLAIVTAQGGAQDVSSCFVPADVVPALERKALK